ncbi:hypothetical protein QE152_g9604 [Popillia japonica]|uniref:Uncharacterized protein n=1 Tax=Popillia japonica TaxID=7064 RepID=A0AAW1LY16_POPJA
MPAKIGRGEKCVFEDISEYINNLYYQCQQKLEENFWKELENERKIVDVISLPPYPDELTDEDEAPEDDLGIVEVGDTPDELTDEDEAPEDDLGIVEVGDTPGTLCTRSRSGSSQKGRISYHRENIVDYRKKI